METDFETHKGQRKTAELRNAPRPHTHLYIGGVGFVAPSRQLSQEVFILFLSKDLLF